MRGMGPGAHFPSQLLHIFPGILVSAAYLWSVASSGWRSPSQGTQDGRPAGWGLLSAQLCSSWSMMDPLPRAASIRDSPGKQNLHVCC